MVSSVRPTGGAAQPAGANHQAWSTPALDSRSYTMHTLPSLVTGSHLAGGRCEFRLPLAEPTAERLADALLSTEPQRRRELFRAALSGDPALAVWALAQAHRVGRDALTTIIALADWLADQRALFFKPECADGHSADQPDEPPSLADFAEPAGCSLAVAELAAEFARSTGASAEQAYLLGLVHLGSAWLAESAVGSEPPRLPGQALPPWSLDAALQVALPTAKQSPETICLAQAMALVDSTSVDEWRAMGCEARQWIGRWALLGENWGRSGPWAARLATLVERLAAHEQLTTEFDRALETAKLEAMKELAYGAGHEINNPLANISARAQTLLREETDPERRRALAAINTQAFRAHEMIADMMLFARPPQPKPEPCDLGQILRTLVEELSTVAVQQQAKVDLKLPAAAVVIAADPTQIAVAIRSLLVNSLEALVTGGLIEISLAAASAQDPWVRISVADDGPGVPADVRPKVFDPFYSGREAGRGLGLGLSKCWRIVTLHGGQLEVADRQGRGVQFTLLFPAGCDE